jgi:hypothetical protein
MRPVDIIINSSGNLGAVDAARKSLDSLKDAFSHIGGISIGVGVERAFEGIKESIQEAGREFIRFSAEMETARYSIAAMQRQFAPGQFRDFKSALAGSAEVMDIITRKAGEMHVSIEDAIETYRTSAGAMYAGGIHDLQKQVDLALMLQQAMRGLGVAGFQATRDIQDILTGRSHMTKAGRELGLSDEDIKKAEDAGRLYEFLNEKLGAYAEAGKAAGDTLNAAFTDFHTEVLKLGQDLSAPMFEELKKGVHDMLEELKKPEFRESLRPLGEGAAEVARAFFEGTKLAAEHADVIVRVGKEFAILVGVVTSLKAIYLAIGLAKIALDWVTTTAAVAENTVALTANAAAAEKAAAAQATAVTGARRWKTLSEVGVAGAVVPVVAAGAISYGAGTAVDEAGWNPLRRLARHFNGHEETADSGKDETLAIAERNSFADKHQPEFSKDYKAIGTLEDRLKLEKKLQDEISKRQVRIDDAGYAEKRAINDSIEGLQRELSQVQKLTEAQLKRKKAKNDAEAAVNNLITGGAGFNDALTGTENDLQGSITGVSESDAREATEKRLKEAKKKTGITDFTDYKAMRDSVSAIRARGDQIDTSLSKSAAAKAQWQVGQKMNADDILSDAQERELQKERGQLTNTLKLYRSEYIAGIAAQEELRKQQLKPAEARDAQLLENAKGRGDGKEVARLEEKMVHDKALEQGKSMGLDPKAAEKWATGAVEATKAERAASLDRFQKEIQIAELKKAGHAAEARNLERRMLAKDYAERYGLSDKDAMAAANRKVASEKSNVGAIRPEVDRYTRIGLFTGGGARNPLEGPARETNAWLQRIYDKLPDKSTPTKDEGIVGAY